ncbi:hypothetical protein H0H92_005290 [Tricholoma furcatifolium]|nr:hypothetical protein H0H92_005290 [Tricholoma furcatifolium]
MGYLSIQARPSTSGAVIFYGATKSSTRQFGKKQLADAGKSQLDTSLCEQDAPTSSVLKTPTSLSRCNESKDDDSQHLVSRFNSPVNDFLPSVTSSGIVALAKVLFANIPYIQVISSIVQQIVQIANDVQVNKDRTRELTDKVMIYANVIFSALAGSQMSVEHGLSSLESELLQITSVLEAIYTMLQSLADSSLTSRINLVLQRQEIFGR